MHFDGHGAVALAGLAATAGDIEREVAGGVSAFLALGQRGKQFADGVKCLDVGHGIGARCPPDGRLIDQHHFVDPLAALDALDLRARPARDLSLVGGQGVVEHIVHQGRFARSRHSGDAHQHAQRNGHVHSLQIVRTCPSQFDLPARARSPRRGRLDAQLAIEITSGERCRIVPDLVIRPTGNQPTAVLACARAKVEDAIRRAHDLDIVFHYENRVAQVAQVVQDLDEPCGVAAMQSDGRLIENVKRADQPRSQRGRELDTLCLAAR